MAYGKITNGILVQKQPYKDAGFVVIPDDAVCGQVTADGGLTFKPPAPTKAERWATYQNDAKAALAESDKTVARISEAVALGNTTLTTPDVVAFMQMRADLRAILSQKQPSTIPTTLPTAPYPAGT